MAVADWEILDMYGNPVSTELRTDVVFEGNKSVRFGIDGENGIIVIHKQTKTDSPVLGAIKTACYFQENTYFTAGFTFKYIDYKNYIRIVLNSSISGELVKVVDGNESTIAEFNLSITMQKSVWYILEAICDDENNTIVFRIRDENENLLDEHILNDAIPSEFKGKGGGIGLHEWYDDAYFDLTKIYY